MIQSDLDNYVPTLVDSYDLFIVNIFKTCTDALNCQFTWGVSVNEFWLFNVVIYPILLVSLTIIIYKAFIFLFR